MILTGKTEHKINAFYAALHSLQYFVEWGVIALLGWRCQEGNSSSHHCHLLCFVHQNVMDI
jgi:hypothetical protein